VLLSVTKIALQDVACEGCVDKFPRTLCLCETAAICYRPTEYFRWRLSRHAKDHGVCGSPLSWNTENKSEMHPPLYTQTLRSRGRTSR